MGLHESKLASGPQGPILTGTSIMVSLLLLSVTAFGLDDVLDPLFHGCQTGTNRNSWVRMIFASFVVWAASAWAAFASGYSSGF